MSANKRAGTFLGVTFALSAGPVAIAWVGGVRDIMHGGLASLIFLLSPALGALLCAALFEKGARVEALGIRFRPNWWWLAALAAPFILAPTGIGAVLAFSPYNFAGFEHLAQQPDTIRQHLTEAPNLGFAGLFLASMASYALFAIPEELGWRGYLYAQWRRFGFWRASFATGFVWSIWHWPVMVFWGVDIAPGHELFSLVLFTLSTTLLAPVMTLLRDRGRSIWAAVIFHGAMNAVAPLVIRLWSPPDFPWGQLAFGAMMALSAALIAVFQRNPNRARQEALG